MGLPKLGVHFFFLGGWVRIMRITFYWVVEWSSVFWDNGMYRYVGIMENQISKKIEHRMEAGINRRFSCR